MPTPLTAFVAALALSLAGTAAVRAAAPRLGCLDHPGDHKQHASPTPTLGGVAILLAVIGGVIAGGSLPPALLALLVGATFLGVVGVLDDLYGVDAVIKLGCLALAIGYGWYSGNSAAAWLAPLPSFLLTFLWVGFVASAFNGVDNADGAAGGLAVIASLACAFLAFRGEQPEVGLLALVLAGAAAGFLVFNLPLPRATIFLGDSGSLVLGYLLGFLTMQGTWSSDRLLSATLGGLLLFVPMFDFVFILVARGLRGQYRTWKDPICMCARDHSFHHLMHFGMNSRVALAVLYGVQAVAAMAAAWICGRHDVGALGLLLTVVVISAAVGLVMGVGWSTTLEDAPAPVSTDGLGEPALHFVPSHSRVIGG